MLMPQQRPDVTTQFRCFGCGQPVSSPLPDDAVLRAIAWCDWCIDEGKDQNIPADKLVPFTPLVVEVLRAMAQEYPDTTAINYFLTQLASHVEALIQHQTATP